jgi:hypothetical protein
MLWDLCRTFHIISHERRLSSRLVTQLSFDNDERAAPFLGSDLVRRSYQWPPPNLLTEWFEWIWSGVFQLSILCDRLPGRCRVRSGYNINHSER